MKKGATIVGVVFLILVVGVYFFFVGKEFEYKFSESDIQNTLEKSLPITKTYLFIIQVTLKNPRVELENGSNRVNAGLDVVFNIKVGQNPEPLGGSVDVSGGVRYFSEAGMFFLTDPNIEQLRIQGVSDMYTNKVNEALSKALSEYYSENPIYTLNAFDAKSAAAKMVLKNVIVVNQELVITLGV